MELLLSGLGMLACLAAMMALMPLFGWVASVVRRRADDTGHRASARDAAQPR